MNRELSTWNTTEEKGDQMRICYKGKQFMIPRSDYTKRLTQEDHKRANSVGQDASSDRRQIVDQVPDATINRPTSDTKFFSKLVDGFKESLAPSNSTNHITQKSEPVQNYTLEDAVESNETIVKRPIWTVSSLECAETFGRPESNVTFAIPSAGSMSSQNSQQSEASLLDLKARLITIINQTIDQLEAQQDLAKWSTAGNIQMHPCGDGSRLVPDRVQNIDQKGTSKRETRLGLLTEIEAIVVRLKNMERN